MSLKAINDKAGPFGGALREMVHRHVSLGNKLAASSALLPTLLLRGGVAAKQGEAAPSKPALSGGSVVEDEHTESAMQTLFDAVPVPTDEEIDAASGGMLDDRDRANVLAAIRAEAVLRFVAEACAARCPANDI